MPTQYAQDRVKNCPGCYKSMYVYSELQDQSGEYTILSIGNYKQPANRFLLINRNNFFIACGDSIGEAEQFAVQFGLKPNITQEKIMPNYQELIQDTVTGLEVELFTHPSIVKVEVVKKDNWYDFQLTTNQEFLSDEVLDDIFELVIDVNFDLRQKIGDKIYFRHSFVGVRKYYVENEEFDSLSSAYEKANKQIEGDWLTEEGLTPYQLIEVRDI